MSVIPPIGDDPRYVRVTYMTGEGGKTSKWIGMVRREGDMLKGTKQTDDPVEKNGVVLHLLYAKVEHVVKIELQDPVYEKWVRWEGWQ